MNARDLAGESFVTVCDAAGPVLRMVIDNYCGSPESKLLAGVWKNTMSEMLDATRKRWADMDGMTA